MGREKTRAVFIESKVLDEMHRGSYEELLTTVDQAVAESDLFGEGGHSLFATYPDKVVVATEEGVFFEAKYAVKDGLVSLSSAKRMSVNVISEGDAASSGVNTFFEGGSLADSMRSLMALKESKGKSPLDKLQEKLDRLFSGGRIWKKHVSENRQSMGHFAWDVDFGKIDHTYHPMFDGLIEQEDGFDEEAARGVIAGLVGVEKKVAAMLANVMEAHEAQQKKTSGSRDPDEDQSLARYESFASDYIEYLNSVLGFVSGAVQEANDGGCVLCAAKVHDEVMVRFRDMDLAGRFVRKVAEGFTK